MAFSPEERAQRPLNYALIDEVDSILIDEARTPLIISGPAEDSSELYAKINLLIPELVQLQEKEDEEGVEGDGDYTIDEKGKQIHLTERGQVKVKSYLQNHGLIEEGDSLYSAGNITLLSHIYAGLRANKLYQKDVDYVVKDNEVIIVDEHTGSYNGRSSLV